MAKSVKKAMVIEPVSETVKEYRNDVNHYFKSFLMKQNEKLDSQANIREFRF